MSSEKTRLLIFASVVAAIMTLCACPANKKSVYEQLTAEGDSLFLEKKYSEAIDVWGKALAVNNNAVNLHYKSGLACMQLENYIKAEQFFKKNVELKPDDWNAWIKLGCIRLFFGDASSAQEIWDTIPVDRQKKSDATIFHGDLLLLRRQLENAEQAYRKAIGDNEHSREGLAKLAVCLLAQGRHDEAEELFNRLDSQNISEAKVLIQMANYCKLSGKPLMAERYYLEALKDEPSGVSSRINLALLYESDSQKEKALEVLRPVIDRININRPMKKLLAKLLISLDQLHEAGKVLDELYQGKGDDIEVLMLKGTFHLLSREPSIAIAFYQAAIDIRPQFAPARYWLGTSYLLSGHDQLGLRNLIAALRIDNKFSDAELAIAAYYYKKKNYQLASEYAQRVIDKHRGGFRGYMILGNIFLAQTRFADAVEMFQNALTLDPGSLPARYFKARALEMDGKSGEALALYHGILEQNRALAEVGKNYAQLLIKTGRIDEAVAYFEKSAGEMPDNGHIHSILGEVYMASGLKEKAIGAMTRAIGCNPRLRSAYLDLSGIFAKNQEIEKQKEILQKGIDNIPGFSDAYARLGLLYLSEHREEEAVRLLEKGYDSNRNDPFLANDLAALYLDMDINAIKAFELAQRAYQQLPDIPAFSDTLGWAYCKKGIYNSAIWYFNDALQHLGRTSKSQTEVCAECETPDRAEDSDQTGAAVVHYHLGFALFKTGQEERAAQSIEKALKLGLAGADKVAAETLLGQIRTSAAD